MKITTTFQELKNTKQAVVFQSFHKVWEPDFIEFPLSMRVHINRDFYDDQTFARVEKWDDKSGWLLVCSVGINLLHNMKKVSTCFPADKESISYAEKHEKAALAAMEDAENLLNIALQIIK